MKQALVRCGLAAALLVATASEARADPPDISGIGTRQPTFIAGAGSTGFSTTFLFGRAGNSNTLLYRLGDVGMWNRIFLVTGNSPNPTVSPAPGTTVAFNFGSPLVANTQVFFALCQGNIPTGNLSQCTGQGPFLTGAAATNVISLTASQWNVARGAFGVDAVVGETVFGFEDKRLNISDEDFNDLVFSTNLREASQIVPEPTSIALMMVGMFGFAGMAARRRNRSA